MSAGFLEWYSVSITSYIYIYSILLKYQRAVQHSTRRGETERRSAHPSIPEVPEGAQASAERIPIKGAELSDSYDACAILVDKRPSGALLVI